MYVLSQFSSLCRLMPSDATLSSSKLMHFLGDPEFNSNERELIFHGKTYLSRLFLALFKAF